MFVWTPFFDEQVEEEEELVEEEDAWSDND